MKLNKIIIGLLVCFFALNLAAQSDSTLSFSLAEAQNYAIENFFMSKNAALNIESAKKKIMEMTALGLPQISGSGRYDYVPGEIANFDIGSEMASGFGPVFEELINNGVLSPSSLPEPGEPTPIAEKQNFTYSLIVSQLIFSGEYIVGLQASKTYLKMSEEAYEKTQIELKQMLANSYYTILILQVNEKLLLESTDNLKKISSETRAISEKGLLDKTEADQIDINLKRIENQLFSVQRQLAFMNKMFKYQLGLAETANVILTDSLKTLVDNNLVVDINAYSFDLNNHIDYKLLETQEQLSLLSLKREKSTYLPSLSGFYQYQDKVVTPPIDFSLQHIVGVTVNVPIFSSGLRSSRVSQAKISLMQSQNIKSQESTRLILEAQQASFDYQSALERFNNEKDNFDLSKRILESTTQKFKLGMVSSMDLTLTNNQYIQSEITYSAAILDLLNAKVKLDKAYSKL